MVVGEPIAPPSDWPGKGEGAPCPAELIDAMHEKELAELQRIFEKYKKAAGYPDATLEVL
jgi:hypothetical protein